MTNAAAQVVLYGKLPGHGDFLSRGLVRDQETSVDACLTKSLQSAQASWAGDFEETYLSAQPWLFASNGGTAIIIPSIDKVGRKFPLYLAVLKAIVLQVLYDATIDAISESREVDQLVETLAKAPQSEHSSSTEPAGSWFCIDPEAPRLPACWERGKMKLEGPVLTLGEVK